MKVAIVGSRSAVSVDIASALESRPSEIISGGAVGVDTLAAEYARANGIKLSEYLLPRARLLCILSLTLLSKDSKRMEL